MVDQSSISEATTMTKRKKRQQHSRCCKQASATWHLSTLWQGAPSNLVKTIKQITADTLFFDKLVEPLCDRSLFLDLYGNNVRLGMQLGYDAVIMLMSTSIRSHISRSCVSHSGSRNRYGCLLLLLGVYCVPLGLQLGLAIRCQKKPCPPQPTPKNAHGSHPWGEGHNKAIKT